MNAIAPRAASAVASLANLRSGLQNVSSTIVSAGGDPFLRLLTDGTWVYGADNVEVEPGSLWAVNPFSLQHGWVAWTDHPGKQANEIVGEVMVPMTSPLPPQAELRDVGWPWVQQLKLQFQCMTGEDTGTQVVYKTSSTGGANAVKALVNKIMAQLDVDPDSPVAVLELTNDHYMHKKWGKTFVPIFDVRKWANMDGVAEPVGEAAPAAPEDVKEPAAPARARTRAAAPAAAKEETKPAPEEKVAVTADDRKAALLAELARLEGSGEQQVSDAPADAPADAGEPAPRRRRR